MIRPLVLGCLLLGGCSTVGERETVVGGVAGSERMMAASVEILVGGHLAGTGWIADESGIVVTASHGVVAKSDALEVSSATLGRLPARLLAHDLGHDLALLRLEQADEPYPALRLTERAPAVGDPVFLWGSVLYRSGLQLTGTVARARPIYEPLGLTRDYARALLIHGQAPPGTSGGAWCDADGRVVACQSGAITHGRQFAGVAIAAPADAIRGLLARKANVDRPTLGCGLEDLESQSAGFIARLPNGADGVVTVPVHPEGPAAEAGLNAETLILAIDGVAIRSRDELLTEVRRRSIGDEVSLTVVDPDRPAPREVSILLGRLGWPNRP